MFEPMPYLGGLILALAMGAQIQRYLAQPYIERLKRDRLIANRVWFAAKFQLADMDRHGRPATGADWRELVDRIEATMGEITGQKTVQ